ncbi:MAG: trypsin-like peptidase domain-containing protein [Defluviitaleaceae bacterium]|nr:trypsin-like peptidase domain-containing protein [Defluviitaleaceae bacterium]
MNNFNGKDYYMMERVSAPAQIPARKKPGKLRNAFLVTLAFALMAGTWFASQTIAERRFNAILEDFAYAWSNEITAPADTSITLIPATSPVWDSPGIDEIVTANMPTNTFTLTQLFERSNPAVVAIATEVTTLNIFGQITVSPSAGSGFVISPDGYIVTNSHVLDGVRTDRISVLLYDGTRHPAIVIGRSPDDDIAVLRIEASSLAYLNFGNSYNIQVGEQVAAIGNPLGELNNSMTVGVISALDREINIDGQPFTMLQTDAAINRGNSGGPLLNLQGHVIGVVTAKSGGNNVEGLGFAIPSNKAQEVVLSLIDNTTAEEGRPVMGIMVGEGIIGDGDRIVFLTSITENGAAHLAGLLLNDIIRSMNGTPIRTFNDLRAILDNSSVGDIITVTVERLHEDETSTTFTVDIVLQPLDPFAHVR